MIPSLRDLGPLFQEELPGQPVTPVTKARARTVAQDQALDLMRRRGSLTLSDAFQLGGDRLVGALRLLTKHRWAAVVYRDGAYRLVGAPCAGHHCERDCDFDPNEVR